MSSHRSDPDSSAGVDSRPGVQMVCLDMAGTTVADGDAVIESFSAAADEIGLTGAERESAMEYVRATMGLSKIEVFRALVDGDESRAAAANQAFERHYDSVVAAGRLAPVAGAEELFAQCRDDGISVCLTTGFAPPTRDAILDALGWRELVDLVLSPVDAGRGRPYPDMILTAVIRLGIDDVRAVAVAGDTSNDLWSGHRAGASIVAGVLTGAHDRTALESAPHTHVLPSVAHLSPLLDPSV